jgi:hypothetical protein
MNISFYESSITAYMYRFFLMMFAVIAAVFTGQLYLLVLAPILFLSMMLGVKVSLRKAKQ